LASIVKGGIPKITTFSVSAKASSWRTLNSLPEGRLAGIPSERGNAEAEAEGSLSLGTGA
jgi:hypothetical protein